MEPASDTTAWKPTLRHPKARRWNHDDAIEPLTRLFTALIVFQVAGVSLILSGSLRLMMHSVGTRWQKSLQATVGRARGSRRAQ